ncbi:MAG: hypothetical protein H6702_09320 [Myxococcales bacterium]|nr:hypothetical protein [Myxococcales bacterium]
MARTAAPAVDDGLNLVPLMNLVVCLIPMVLAGAALTKVGVVETQAPKICSFGCDGVPAQPGLMLHVAVDADGFTLTGDGVAEALAAQAAPGPRILRAGDGGYDHPKLYGALTALKAEFPGTTGFTLSAAPGLPYHHIITVMDLAQHRLTEDDYPDRASLRTATRRVGPEGAPEPLMPAVTLAVTH